VRVLGEAISMTIHARCTKPGSFLPVAHHQPPEVTKPSEEKVADACVKASAEVEAQR
jgi:hypothetical protein